MYICPLHHSLIQYVDSLSNLSVWLINLSGSSLLRFLSVLYSLLNLTRTICLSYLSNLSSVLLFSLAYLSNPYRFSPFSQYKVHISGLSVQSISVQSIQSVYGSSLWFICPIHIGSAHSVSIRFISLAYLSNPYWFSPFSQYMVHFPGLSVQSISGQSIQSV